MNSKKDLEVTSSRTIREDGPVSTAIGSTSSGIFLEEVRVRNFRCLKSVDVRLEVLTVIVGQNNSGKTSFLNALFAAIGAGLRTISSEDIFLKCGEGSAPKDRPVIVDILIRPTDSEGTVSDTFPEGSPWLELWGSGIVQDASDDRDQVAIRTSFKWNAIKGEYALERRFLKDWQSDPEKWELSKPVESVGSVTTQQIEPLALYLLDAKRDIADDQKTRGSFWSKMVEDHGLEPSEVKRIEDILSGVNQEIVSSSGIFTHIETHLRNFHETLSCDRESVTITPLVRHLRDLSRGMDVVLSTRGAPSFPIHYQGMGTRSLGTFFTFWAFTEWRQKQAKTNAMHPLMALEEPETHLHPQAQRALFRQIKKMPGQRIVTTHSPYVCSQAEIAQMRHFCKQGEETIVSQVEVGPGGDALKSEDLRKIDRQVMNTRGDMIFARALVFFEGETEEQALPDFAEQHWKKHPNDLGFSFIGVGGHSGYLPFLRMAESFRIPWYIFSDGEPKALTEVDRALAAIGQDASSSNLRVVVLPDAKDFEAYIVNSSTRTTLIEAIIAHRAKSPEHRASLQEKWGAQSEAKQLESIIAVLKADKTQYGAVVGRTIAVPNLVQVLFERIDKELSREAA
jgi:putative ATP-dependent endonuclease of OLD family